MSRYLRYSTLTAAEKKRIGNGCGPSWVPRKIKKALFGWLFHACCQNHDFGYTVGGNEARRWVCDWLFFAAMLRDTIRCEWYRAFYRLPCAIIFYFCVMVGGWYSFSYRTPISTRDEFFSKKTTNKRVKKV